MASVGGIVPVPVYKAELVASGLRCRQSLHKDNKNFRDYQIGTISRQRLTLSAIVCVWRMCVSIVSTSVTPEYEHRCRCKARASTRTPICSQCLRIRLRNSGTHLRVLCIGSDPSGSAHRGAAHSWTAGYVCGGYDRNRHGRAF